MEKENCNHTWSDFYPVDSNANLVKICFKCKTKKTKKDFLKEKRKNPTVINLAKVNIKNVHIDLFW